MLAMTTEWGCVLVAGCGGGENDMNLNLEGCCYAATRGARLG